MYSDCRESIKSNTSAECFEKDEYTNESYDVEDEVSECVVDDQFNNYNEDDGEKKFCEHLLSLFEEIQGIIFDNKNHERYEKKILQIIDVYNAYKKYLSYYVSMERLQYIDKIIIGINVDNICDKILWDFYKDINEIIFDPYLMLA